MHAARLEHVGGCRPDTPPPAAPLRRGARDDLLGLTGDGGRAAPVACLDRLRPDAYCRQQKRTGRHGAIGQKPPTRQVLNCGGDCLAAQSHNRSLEPRLNQSGIRNDHYTLAQLRLGQAMFARRWYQSWRHVSFLQHNAALHLLSRSAVPTGACCKKPVSPVATMAMPSRNSLSVACSRSSDHCSIADCRTLRRAPCGSRASSRVRRRDWASASPGSTTRLANPILSASSPEM